MDTRPGYQGSEVKTKPPRNLAPRSNGKAEPAQPFNPAFDKRLMRRRWSEKEIVTIIHTELERNGKLTQKVREVANHGNGVQA